MTTTRTRETRVRQVEGFTGATEWYEVVTVPGDERIGSYWRTGRAWAADHDASGRTSRHSTPEDARDWVAAQW